MSLLHGPSARLLPFVVAFPGFKLGSVSQDVSGPSDRTLPTGSGRCGVRTRRAVRFGLLPVHPWGPSSVPRGFCQHSASSRPSTPVSALQPHGHHARLGGLPLSLRSFGIARCLRERAPNASGRWGLGSPLQSWPHDSPQACQSSIAFRKPPRHTCAALLVLSGGHESPKLHCQRGSS